jgi:hypothetical protein
MNSCQGKSFQKFELAGRLSNGGCLEAVYPLVYLITAKAENLITQLDVRYCLQVRLRSLCQLSKCHKIT